MPFGETVDTTARFGSALAAADVIVAADPGPVRRLAADLGIPLAGREVSGAAEPPVALVPGLLAELAAGRDVLLVTDPLSVHTAVKFPDVIVAAAEAGAAVTVLPGPSAVTAALTASGLSAERFVFEGVPPDDPQERERRFTGLVPDTRTLIFVVASRRVAQILPELAAAFGADRRAAICRSFATAAENVLHGPLGDLAGPAVDDVAQDDVTVVVAGAPAPHEVGGRAPAAPEALQDAVAQVEAQVKEGKTTRDAVTAVAAETGVRKRDLYNAASQTGHGGRPNGSPG